MILIELPRRRRAPRVFVEPAGDLPRRVDRALIALGELPDELDELPGLRDLADALIALADQLAGDADLEPEDDADGDEALPLFAYANHTIPP